MLSLFGCATTKVDYTNHTFEWSDGNCESSEECTALSYGCGGGRIVCTNNPDKWKGMITTCEIIEDHPSKEGFRCDCVVEDNKCGWVK